MSALSTPSMSQEDGWKQLLRGTILGTPNRPAHANPVAQSFDQKTQKTVDDARKHAIATMQQAAIASKNPAVGPPA